ncbi:hypothetical protein NDU88_000298 [Pleurodeles waltl]|uniref:Uncharacterized protein n=1 Tax=Pleurodeles waltl TaxID=8319 RepID=A0AAV7S978_PLEWA|nr:hypothetical protein NDU88_000298 [Pleurodeles waltl]
MQDHLGLEVYDVTSDEIPPTSGRALVAFLLVLAKARVTGTSVKKGGMEPAGTAPRSSQRVGEWMPGSDDAPEGVIAMANMPIMAFKKCEGTAPDVQAEKVLASLVQPMAPDLGKLPG